MICLNVVSLEHDMVTVKYDHERGNWSYLRIFDQYVIEVRQNTEFL